MNEEIPKALKAFYFVGFWMPLEKTVEHYITIAWMKERLDRVIGSIKSQPDPIWHQNASVTICRVDPSTGNRKWVDSSIVLASLFNSWVQSCGIVKPKMINDIDCNCTRGGKTSTLKLELRDPGGPSWLNQSLLCCPLLSVMTVGFSGFEIDRVKLSKVIEVFSQKMMMLMASIIQERKSLFETTKASRPLANLKQPKILIPLHKITQENTVFVTPQLSPYYSLQTVSQQFDAQLTLTKDETSPEASFLERAVGNPVFVDRLMNYVQRFIRSSNIKWECVLEYSLYVVEIDKATLVRWGMPVGDYYQDVESVRILWPAENFYQTAMKIYAILTLTGKVTFPSMVELMTKSFPESFGPACSSCLLPIFNILEKHSHILYQIMDYEQKISEFCEVTRQELLDRWKEFITFKSKGLFSTPQ